MLLNGTYVELCFRMRKELISTVLAPLSTVLDHRWSGEAWRVGLR